jgi:hypothetical protein
LILAIDGSATIRNTVIAGNHASTKNDDVAGDFSI